jgi:hypothetical protein
MELSLLLGFALTARRRWCMVIPGISRGMPDSLHRRLRPFIPTRGFLGTAYRVFGSTLQGLNQSIVGLSPLSETTYSTSHVIPNDGSL